MVAGVVITGTTVGGAITMLVAAGLGVGAAVVTGAITGAEVAAAVVAGRTGLDIPTLVELEVEAAVEIESLTVGVAVAVFKAIPMVGVGAAVV